MSGDNYVVGTCDKMCPEQEIQERKKERLIHFYETFVGDEKSGRLNRNRMVKEFSRSAAGHYLSKPSSLRTFPPLLRTIEYLLDEILLDTRRPFNFVYDFIFDRLRAVRQDIVIQNFPSKVVISLLEPIVMFLTYSTYRLSNLPIEYFDPKICNQHLQECLKKLLCAYDDCDLNQTSGEYDTSKRIIIESIYIVFNLGATEAIIRALTVPISIKKDPLCSLSLRLSLDYLRDDYYSVLKHWTKLPHILSCAFSHHLGKVRRQMLKIFSVAYNSKSLTVNLNFLQQVLFYDKDIHLHDILNYYGLEVDKETERVRFEKVKFDNAKHVIKDCLNSVVEQKLSQFDLTNLLLLKTI